MFYWQAMFRIMVVGFCCGVDKLVLNGLVGEDDDGLSVIAYIQYWMGNPNLTNPIYTALYIAAYISSSAIKIQTHILTIPPGIFFPTTTLLYNYFKLYYKPDHCLFYSADYLILKSKSKFY